MAYQDYGHLRRRFPRRAFRRSAGLLHRGLFEMAECEEIGEGGMSFSVERQIPEGEDVVVSFRIPGGDFVSLRGSVRSARPGGRGFVHGIAFTNIAFTHKRQIRSFVSERTSRESVSF